MMILLTGRSYNDQCQWPIRYADMARHYGEVGTVGNVVGDQDGNDQFPDGIFGPPKAHATHR